MRGIERHPVHDNPVDHLALVRLDAVAVVDPATRVVGEAGDDLHLMAAALQLLGEQQPLEGGFGVEPLGHHPHPHGDDPMTAGSAHPTLRALPTAVALAARHIETRIPVAMASEEARGLRREQTDLQVFEDRSVLGDGPKAPVQRASRVTADRSVAPRISQASRGESVPKALVDSAHYRCVRHAK